MDFTIDSRGGRDWKRVRVINTFTRITPYCIGAFRCFPFSRMPPQVKSMASALAGVYSACTEVRGDISTFLNMLCFDVGELGPFSPVLA